MTDRAKLKIALQALEDIVSPLAKMHRELREGYELDGAMALRICKEPSHLQKIASDALKEIEG